MSIINFAIENAKNLFANTINPSDYYIYEVTESLMACKTIEEMQDNGICFRNVDLNKVYRHLDKSHRRMWDTALQNVVLAYSYQVSPYTGEKTFFLSGRGFSAGHPTMEVWDEGEARFYNLSALSPRQLREMMSNTRLVDESKFSLEETWTR